MNEVMLENAGYFKEPPETIKEILEDFATFILTPKIVYPADVDIDNTVAQIKSLIKSKLLLKKKIVRCPHGEIYECRACELQHRFFYIHNQAISEMEKVIEGI